MDFRKLLLLLTACSRSSSLKQSKLLHQKIISLGLQSNLLLRKDLINAYFACNDSNSARLVFEASENPSDISLWNSLAAGYTKSFKFDEALELFRRLLKTPGNHPDCYTYPSVLKACGALGRVIFGKLIHANLVKNGLLGDVVVVSSLVGMYGWCGSFEDATQVFEEMPARDVASWNTVISCYYHSGKAEEALDVFAKMKDSGFVPNSVTLTTAISACSRMSDLERGREIHKELMNDRFVMDDYVNSALVDMYGKCGCLDLAKEVFSQVQRKNVIVWNSMIQGYAARGDSKSAIGLLDGMIKEDTCPTLTTMTSIMVACSKSSQLQHGKFIHGFITRKMIETDTFFDTSLLDLYFKCDKVELAEKVFARIQKTCISWNVMISGYVASGLYFQALTIYDDMIRTGLKPDAITFTSVLPACSQLATLEKGKRIHSSIMDSRLEKNELVMSALLDMYAKCGDVEEAQRLFCQLPQRDLVSWTTMITAYGSHGQAFEALRLFHDMQKSGVKPDGITFLAVLSACSHGGFVDEGLQYFNQMRTQYRINPSIEHYSCLIDLFGRARRLYEAYDILQQNAELRGHPGLLSTLFSACSLHRNHELGKRIAGLLVNKDPNDVSTYIGLSNLYASVKRWDEVRKARSKIKDIGLRKLPGCSWIEVDEKLHAFFAEDKFHPEAEMVYGCLMALSDHMDDDTEIITEEAVQ